MNSPTHSGKALTVQYMSDLHLEFRDNTRWIAEHMPQPAAQVMVIAGDMITLNSPKLRKHPLFDWCSHNFELTVIVPGNHEFYDGFDVAEAIDGLDLELRPGVRYCCNKAVSIGHTALLCTTLWSEIDPQCRTAAQLHMPDYSRIVYKGRQLTADDSAELHRRCRDWLTEAINRCTASHKVVVTHHCPVNVEDPRYGGNELTSAFIAPMEDYVRLCGADSWIFGHTHYNAADGLRLGNTVLHTNQMGNSADVCHGYSNAAKFELL